MEQVQNHLRLFTPRRSPRGKDKVYAVWNVAPNLTLILLDGSETSEA